MNARTLPDFIIVGAPKCGTTALAAYLAQSPKVFIPKIKEPHFFCDDFEGFRRVRTEGEYRALYEGVKPEQKAGDASVWYLYSAAAAESAARFAPDARIIIMFRDPVEMIQSLHSQLRFSGRENTLTPAEGWALIAARRAGQSLPEQVVEPSHLFYDEVCMYWSQLQRWRAVFPDNQILAIDFDDFRADPDAVTRRAFSFIGVEPPAALDTRPVNEARTHRFPRAAALLRHPPFPFGHIKKALKTIPWVRANPPLRSVYAAMSRKEKPEPFPESLRKEIRATYAIEMEAMRSYARGS
ncbi:MAG: sulfotransferase [Novosphingobium sp.]